jgi:hypothetical protein
MEKRPSSGVTSLKNSNAMIKSEINYRIERPSSAEFKQVRYGLMNKFR